MVTSLLVMQFLAFFAATVVVAFYAHRMMEKFLSGQLLALTLEPALLRVDAQGQPRRR